MSSLVGMLLVATPVMEDPNFAHSVVLVCAHDEDGAVGLVLDRPTEIPVGEHLPQWAPHAATPPVVFLGGPVQLDVAIGLADAGASMQGWTQVVGTAGLIDLEDSDPVTTGRVRVFAGYTGWSPGQLEGEVAGLDWIVVPAHLDDLFDPDPDGIRRRALLRKGGMFPAYVHYPEDPGLN